jgi:hypothetical protein
MMMKEEQRRRIAASYLTHILVAIEAGDHAAPFRDFLDNWYAYEVGTGHLTSGGRPIWFNNPGAHRHHAALSRMHFISRGAAEILARSTSDRAGYVEMWTKKDPAHRLMVDHAVPIGVLRRTMFEDEALRSPAAIGAFLGRYFRLGVLTSSEDQTLNRMGLRDTMPADWDRSSVFARYQAADINHHTPERHEDSSARRCSGASPRLSTPDRAAKRAVG